MEKYEGKAVCQNIAIGKIWYYSREEQNIKRYIIEDVQAEITRYENAKKQAVKELGELYEKALKEVGEVSAAIFEVHALMLEDNAYNDSVYHFIENQKINAEYAVAITGDKLSETFTKMDDDYLCARAIDVKDISERVIRILSGENKAVKLMDEPVILIAKDLAPSETVRMDKSKLLGFVTELGSPNSHTAILARTIGIPALTGIAIKPEWSGKQAVVDGYHGILYIDPDEKTLEAMKNLQKKWEEKKELYRQLKGKDTVTKSGRKINLYANIGSESDVDIVMENDAEGIGLFRSEFLYLEKENYPTEEEQFQSYKKVAQKMAGKKVIIRTLDIGADKQVDYFKLQEEENPAMGFRAIRICLERPEIFKTQLRAIYRASIYGQISIMYPMITSVEEVKKIKEIVESVKKELKEQGIEYADVKQGIMIETPAAAIISDMLAGEVDFFSIGTNDLTQYTLAIDRQNTSLEPFFMAHHPAVLRLIQMVVDHGHKGGCQVGICGELGADPELTEMFVKMGIDELSVSPGRILPLREIIRNLE